MSTTSMNASGVAIVRAPSGKGFRSKSAALRAQERAEKAKRSSAPTTHSREDSR